MSSGSLMTPAHGLGVTSHIAEAAEFFFVLYVESTHPVEAVFFEYFYLPRKYQLPQAQEGLPEE